MPDMDDTYDMNDLSGDDLKFYEVDKTKSLLSHDEGQHDVFYPLRSR